MSFETLRAVAMARRDAFKEQQGKTVSHYETARSIGDYESRLPKIDGKGFVECLTELGKRKPNFRALDIGCGQGVALTQIAGEYPQSSLSGISARDFREDLEDPGVEEFTREHIRYLVEDAQNLNRVFRGDKFDLIISTWCFYYLADPMNTLRHAYSLLEDNGFLLVHHTGIWLDKQEAEKLQEFWGKQGIEANIPDPTNASSISVALRKTRNCKLPMPFFYTDHCTAIPTEAISSDSHR